MTVHLSPMSNCENPGEARVAPRHPARSPVPTRALALVRVAGLLSPLAWLAVGCTGLTLEPPPAPPDRARFEAEVLPILARDCAFPTCHGRPERFLRLYVPGRTRLDPATPAGAPPTQAELDADYERARGMLQPSEDDPAGDAPLLRKPLDVTAGGAPHRGLDRFGRDVFAAPDDPRYVTIRAWIEGS